MIEWNIQSRGRVCQACHNPFGDQERFHTLLFDQKQCYERLDVCQTCWTGQFSHQFKVKAHSNQNGQRVFVYEHAKSGDLFTIPDPNLQLDRLEEVQRDVEHLLEHGLQSPVGSSLAHEPAPASLASDGTPPEPNRADDARPEHNA